jgi:hypothetical protein
MTKKYKDSENKKERLQKAVNLLKFILTFDDKEIINSTIESIIEILEEEIND